MKIEVRITPTYLGNNTRRWTHLDIDGVSQLSGWMLTEIASELGTELDRLYARDRKLAELEAKENPQKPLDGAASVA